MAIVPEHKIIYVHIPKTGGTTIGNIIHPNHIFTINGTKTKYSDHFTAEPTKNNVEHKYYSEYEKIIQDKMVNYFVFSFVRNPYSRIFSLWRECCDAYMLQQQHEHKIEKVISCDINQTNTIHYIKDRKSHKQFQNFINILYEEKHQLHLLGNTQFAMIRKYQAQFIGKFENFNNDLKKLLKMLNKHIGKKQYRLPYKYTPMHLNKKSRNSNEYKLFYNKDTKQLVYDLYQNDFIEFNYDQKF